MNLKICEKCPLFSNIIVVYDKNEIICYLACGSQLRIFHTADITKEKYDLLMKNLIENGYKRDKSVSLAIIEIEKVKDKSLLNDIEINKNCEFYAEHMMSGLNENKGNN